MPPDTRRALAVFLAEHASRRRGVVIPEGEAGGHIGYLVRGGCTLAPEAYLFTVIDRAVQAEAGKLPKRQGVPGKVAGHDVGCVPTIQPPVEPIGRARSGPMGAFAMCRTAWRRGAKRASCSAC